VDSLSLLGAVGARTIAEELDKALSQTDAGTARFLLDRLQSEQTVAIVMAVLADAGLSKRMFVAVPREMAINSALPEHVITDQRAVHFRNRQPSGDKVAMLLVNSDDDQGVSLQDMTRIGAKMLTDRADLWVAIAGADLPLMDPGHEAWEAALRGLTSAHEFSLGQIARYVSSVATRMAEESTPLSSTLGYCLPLLGVPRDSTLHIAEKQQRHKSAWRRRYEQMINERAPLLRKQTKNRQIIERDELFAQYQRIKEDIKPEHYAAVERFIEAPQTWNLASEALAELEWDIDHIDALFTGLKSKKVHLAQETREFYEDKDENLLDKADVDYLELLGERTTKQPSDEDRTFYEHHRSLFTERPALKAKWDRFIFGVSVECTDLLVGLVSAIARLKVLSENWAGTKTLSIAWNARGRTQQLALNADVGAVFCLRYRGLQQLFGPNVHWDVGPLFTYGDFLDEQKGRRGYQKNESAARAALRIRLDVVLRIGEPPDARDYAVQVDYMGRPDAVSANLPSDFARLSAKPFCALSVQRVRTSKKGHAQRLALEESASFEAAYDRDAGSFVPPIKRIVGWEDQWSEALDRTAHRIDEAGMGAIRSASGRFHESYRNALQDYLEHGVSSSLLLEQARAYSTLLACLEPYSADSLVRKGLLEPLLRLGVVLIEDGPAAAVIAPWHPLRLAAIAVKARTVGNLVSHILSTDDVEVGDERMYFQELGSELTHPYHPEVVVGYSGFEPCLLAITDTLDDYSLAEMPVSPVGIARTNEDPAAGARRVSDTVSRYLALQPHETASLSVALFECDSAGLPLAAVGALGTLQETEVHCNLTLRHRDRPSLQRVYNDLLEQSEADPDALVASETSRNFMAKLRVGIQIETPTRTRGSESREVDIAFLQDVVARRAKIQWLTLPASTINATIDTHVPPRWAYKAPTTSEAATRYLTCPEQPVEGWSYIAAVAALIERQPNPEGYRRLPVRTISLNDNAIKNVFDDAHNLAEWVVNYDDLLDPEQLRHQGVRVIRYQKDRSNARNLIVSSTARSRVLDVLLRRRLEELGLGIEPGALDALVKRLIDDAIAISGEIVLRASKRGVAAGELIGVVLSAALAKLELGGNPSACFFLDDYASWLGQREEGIADLLFLSFDPVDPTKLRIIVTEAKYVGARAAADARKTSRRQVEATVSRINDALFENPGRLDRDLWLSRLSDLLLDAVKTPRQEKLFELVRRQLRDGTIEIDLRGYSHIFVSESADQVVASDQEPLPLTCGKHSLQEVFSHQATRELLRELIGREGLTAVRAQLGPEKPWSVASWRAPAARPSWMASTSVSPIAVVQPSADSAPIEVLSEPPDSTADTPLSSILVPEASVAVAASGLAGVQPTDSPSLPQLLASRQSSESVGKDTAWLEQVSKTLQRALVGWGLQAKILGTRLTPNAGLVRLLGSDRLETKDVESNRQRLLTTHRLNIISITPRPGEIVVAIEREARDIVSLWNVWAKVPERRSENINLTLVVGLRELDGELLYLNLGEPFGSQSSNAPHTLIAGTTGSGKSILIQNLLVDIAMTNSPDLAKIYCIDPKMGVDYAALQGLPHLVDGIVVDQERAGVVLEGLLVEMDERYRLFAQNRAPNLKAYNAKVPKASKLPAIFLIHDEFAEWMLTDDYKDAVAKTVMRLGVKARAAGIHLFFAAQRPDKDVLPPQLRDNLGNRLILRVEGEGTSEIALGTKGAERLLGKGHCAARLQNEPDIIYAQVPWLSTDDVEAIVRALHQTDVH
jgi:DNA segregation ATPase FtsK/SpoIIIE, S-DNA-T family